ncbi:cbb3-type cytochrome c oxidase subunit I [Pseudonocardia sp. KRD-184]|uniref:Cbb3-type cytochrome c oxidase subunit I n=1 Tax=Pseudonocardia oceani TaxID=2792013 RepID=A0ABS6UG86_9PSEU|nr:cbb3-type cytochrome c oxidase subunit I [Pseudonocardia oceani]MBW0089433.1 cbb3-type cytochrome c oxidase subunit I [Pseudonocardia oceani]MBW0096439.1 cbb3-type cytochrome c oxidase subunit I [Pseudonocardia oceani]MBW0108756.1 cbb3-type cytochrome c oxidase subunit I [Pseudonocardia oceani]MBW0122984.1 cbb3-type cytochrome c oxidase subunit I [Pseudonocardia oceani]MBW0131257.1 cbb3-type cytochrome c oxidase subunit I [Pseudonocardia oceani]
MTESEGPVADGEPRASRGGIVGWLTTTDHKRIGLLTLGTATVLLLVIGALALTIRTQLAQPELEVLDNDTYNQFFTMHGSGMIYLVMTPYAIGLGLYLVPLQIGTTNVAAPRATLVAYYLYLAGAVTMLSGFATSSGAADHGWYSYPPLAGTRYTPGPGVDLWILGVTLAGTGLLIMSATVLWTTLLKRGPGMTMLRMPVFTWSTVATNLMAVGAFPALLVSMGILALGRMNPDLFTENAWNIGYQHVFWFFGHPVVYVMFFPFVGAVAEVLATFSGRRFFGYRITVVSLLTFAALSMSVWGHHMFTTGQAENDYYSLTSILLLVPAGLEYFGLLGTVSGGRLRFDTPMLFALAFIPQFLVGGLTGIMTGTPSVDYDIHDTYFIVAHWHYTLAAGSLFGFFAGFYFWFPKATGILLREGLGKTHFWLWVVGTNLTFFPMFLLGLHGMPRRIPSYLPEDGFGFLNLLATIGAGLLAVGTLVFVVDLVVSVRARRPAPPDPWQGHTLEWATSSPPPPLNFTERFPVPPVRSYAPLLDLRHERERAAGSVGG